MPMPVTEMSLTVAESSPSFASKRSRIDSFFGKRDSIRRSYCIHVVSFGHQPYSLKASTNAFNFFMPPISAAQDLTFRIVLTASPLAEAGVEACRCNLGNDLLGLPAGLFLDPSFVL